MADGFVQRMAMVDEDERTTEGFAIAPGIVKDNVDILGLGRVQVRLPALPAFEPWCRIVAIGAGADRGFVWIPQIDDEVLVALGQNDQRDAYVLGGLWNTFDRPPLSLPSDFLIKRVIKTGIKGGIGHEIEFDDAVQSITITSTTKQKITIDPTTIELKNTAGTLAIKMDNESQTISISAAAKIELKATKISIKGTKVELEGTAIDIKASGPCSVRGQLVKIN